MKKSAAATSPIVPGRYFVFVERLVQEQYQTLTVDAQTEEQAREKALQLFFAGSLAYMACTQVEPPTARVKPMREKHLRKADSVDPRQDAALRTAERFNGPGDEVLAPMAHFPGTRPRSVTRAQARLMCQNFDASGHSNHSGQGGTLWVILEHCADADIPYNLRAAPGLGYYVERSKSLGDGLPLRMSVETVYGVPLD